MGLWGYQDAFWGSDALRGPETDAAAHHERRSSSRTKRRGDKVAASVRGRRGLETGREGSTREHRIFTPTCYESIPWCFPCSLQTC